MADYTNEQLRDYTDKVQVVVTLMPDCEPVEHPTKEGFIEARVWVHTRGMAHFNRPEMEMVDIHPIFAREAFDLINEWALYSVCTQEIKVGENIRAGNSPLDPILSMVASDLAYWEEAECACLRITLGATFLGQACSNPGCECGDKH